MLRPLLAMSTLPEACGACAGLHGFEAPGPTIVSVPLGQDPWANHALWPGHLDTGELGNISASTLDASTISNPDYFQTCHVSPWGRIPPTLEGPSLVGTPSFSLLPCVSLCV